MIMSVIAVPFAFAGGAAAVPADAEDESHKTISGDETVYQGQEVAVNVTKLNLQDGIELRRVNDDGDVGTLVSAPTVQDDGTEQYVVLDTENRDTDQYVLTSKGTGSDIAAPDVEFEVVEMDLDASFDDSEVTDTGTNAETTFEISSEIRNSYAVNISADGLSEDDLVQIFNGTGALVDENTTVNNEYDIARADKATNDYATIDEDEDVLTLFNAEGEWDVDFREIDADEYDFNVEVVDTTASDSSALNVSESEDGEVDFAEAVDVNQGDIAEITLEADNTEEGTLVIGDEEDVGYQANATVDFGDNDEVTVYFDTYAAGNDTLADSANNYEDLIWTDTDGASVSNIEQNTIGGLLAAGYGYEMTTKAVSETDNDYNTKDYSSAAEETLDAPDNVGSLFIEERSTDSVTTWTASEDTVSDVTDEDLEDQPDAVADAIENDLVTEAGDIAYDDQAVFQIEASGLAGLMQTTTGAASYDYNISELGAETNSASDSRLKFEISQTASNPNADDTEVTVDPEDITLVHDKYGASDQYFVIIDTANMGSLDDEDDHDLTLDFAVQDERLLKYDEDDDDEPADVYQSIEQDFAVVERTASLDVADSDLIEVEQDEDEITGQTNIAPGSEVTVRLRGTGDYRFSESQSEIVVSPDGTFAGEFDFSDRDVDTTFEATLRSTGVVGDNPSEDGVVVPASEDPEDGEEPPANETDDMNESDDDMSDDDMSDDSTDESTDDSSDDSTEEETPGFGALVALVAVLGAALLATRRQN